MIKLKKLIQIIGYYNHNNYYNYNNNYNNFSNNYNYSI